MKKILIAAVALLSFGVANAQVFYLGYQNNSFNSTYGSTTHTETAPGFVVGFGQNFEIADGLGIQPAFEMSLNSYKRSTVLGDIKYSNFGIKVPIDFNYGIELGSDLKLYPFAGPSLYLGIANNGKLGDEKESLYDDSLKRFGFGVNFGAFCDFKDVLRLKVGYDMGLSNLYQDGDDDFKYKQNCLTIAIGYLF